MTPDNSRQNTPAEAGMAAALQKNKEAAAAVEDVALELGVVHAVLSTEIAKVAATGDIHTAIDRTEVLETKLNETADKMDEVNAALDAQRASLSHLSNADK
ncbi:hypothetical protein ACSFA8_26555 [Variovorax sp. RT4R15]|uniref:hypothetical protein n=1 Tax=Variovorax sp. RT4R15 TaxID=3443737 RepID=UPI003F47F922